YTTITSQTLTFAGTAGETQTFTVTPTADTKLEANETLTISQSNLSATTLSVAISDGATVTITNDDAAAVTIADISGAENGGAITVTATLDNAVQGGFTVDVSSADGTATTADSDYTTITSQTLTFAGTAGETQTFTVTPTADT
ncbi:Calx-beta domain-containing protein, partial [Roseivirga sp. E12]|uniref:Calx-beta domain-containing protein n=1 Tax=Roseivirga sp. E12 TaxID=2819237 RepID=UPI001ABBF8A0